MSILDYLKDHLLCMDGAMGTQMQKAGLMPGELPEMWNLTHPDKVTGIHCAYLNAGSNVITTNTFGANRLHFSGKDLENVISSALSCAKEARRRAKTDRPVFIAMDIGPCGHLLKPYGDLAFEDTVSLFREAASLGAKHGADFILIETMTDSYETKAALLGAKEGCSLPVFVTNAYEADGYLMSGTPPEAMVAMLEGLGADAIGVNCSMGPEALMPVVDKYLACASVPVICQPNAGLPVSENGVTRYDVDPDDFSHYVEEMLKKGLRICGGCCGTTPDYIRALSDLLQKIRPTQILPKTSTVISSRSRVVSFNSVPVLIGERINPTGKKRFKQALQENDIPFILSEGLRQAEKGAHVLDVNVGLPGIDEAAMLENVICELQAVTDLPLQPDTSDPYAMERALRVYNGKPLINSANGKEESMRAMFPLVKKYGGVLVCLTLDESGIPDTAEGRVAIAKKILTRADEYGISKKDLLFDPLTMAVSAMPEAASVTLESVKRIREELGCAVSLGVSNVSFGLPSRDILNGSFFTMALMNGLSAAIMNPDSAEMQKAYHSYLALTGLDENFRNYMDFSAGFTPGELNAVSVTANTECNGDESFLQAAVKRGLVQQAVMETKSLLTQKEPLSILSGEIIPALDAVGRGFENKTVYLPGLLMSAEAAKAAVEEIKNQMPDRSKTQEHGTIVIATVKGDIHDIGKNIVKLLLDNYGWKVIDLGKDVPPRVIVDTVKETGSRLAALSALMTTTVPAMEETIRLLRAEKPDCRIMVGGAVLTEDYAKKIGADGYAADAMGAVRLADSLR